MSSNNENLQELADDGVAAPFLEIQREAQEDPDLVVIVEYNGQAVEYGQGPGLVHPGEANWLERKMFALPSGCRHRRPALHQLLSAIRVAQSFNAFLSASSSSRRQRCERSE